MESESDLSLPFVATLRKAGQTGSSLLLTVPKEIVRLMKLKADDMVIVKIKRAPKEL